MTVTVSDGYSATVSASAYLSSAVDMLPVASGPAPLSVLWDGQGKVPALSPWYSEMDHAQLSLDFNGVHADTGLVTFTGPGGGTPAILELTPTATVLLTPGTSYPLVVRFQVWSSGTKVVDRTATEFVNVQAQDPGPFWPAFDLNAAHVGQMVHFG